MITNHEANARREVRYYTDALEQAQSQLAGIETRLRNAKQIVAEADAAREAKAEDDAARLEEARQIVAEAEAKDADA
jgi:hypothetical protein